MSAAALRTAGSSLTRPRPSLSVVQVLAMREFTAIDFLELFGFVFRLRLSSVFLFTFIRPHLLTHPSLIAQVHRRVAMARVPRRIVLFLSSV